MPTPTDPDPAPFAATLRAVRDRSGQSQAEIAKKARLTASYLSMLESRRKPPPSDPVVRRLSRALGLEPAFLLEIAHLERTPEDIRQRMAGLHRSLEAEKKVTRRVLRGPLIEMLWHFLTRRGFEDSSFETLRLSRRTRGLVRDLARDARQTATPEAFRERTSQTIESLDPEARDELIEAMPDFSRPPPDATVGGEAGTPVRSGLGDSCGGDDETLPAPTGARMDGAFWFRVPDQDMYPRIQEGDLLLMAPGLDPTNGDLVGVRLPDRDTVRIYLDLHGDTELAATNSSVPPLRPGDGVEVATVARWLSRPLGGEA